MAKSAGRAHAASNGGAAAEPGGGRKRHQKQQQRKRQQPASAAAAAAAASAQPAAPGKPNRPPTAYELRVYKLCKAIPKGRVATYGCMAAVLSSSARAVGQAMRRNPYAPAVPCHRVVAGDLQLGGFSGSWGIHCANVQRKKALLQGEGVAFDGDKVCVSSVVAAAELERLLAQQQPADQPDA